MEIRQTSIEAFNAIRDEGLLKKLHWLVYSTLYTYGPMTGQELDRKIREAKDEEYEDPDRGGYWKRLSELKELGVATELGTRPCRVSGRRAIEWDVTPDKPTHVHKPPVPNSAEINAALDEIKRVFKAAGEQGSAELIKTGVWLRWKANK